MPGFEQRGEELELHEVYHKMDIKGQGRVDKEEFARYLALNPRGWPLAELLHDIGGPNTKIRDEIVNFWFRKLDIESQGSFDVHQLIAFFRAMRKTEYKEMVYADFLLNLFDRDYNGKLDRTEYAAMLRVMLGKEPSPATVNRIDKNGLSRKDLCALLHTIHCDFKKLESSSNVEIAMLFTAVAAAIVGIVWYKMSRK